MRLKVIIDEGREQTSDARVVAQGADGQLYLGERKPVSTSHLTTKYRDEILVEDKPEETFAYYFREIDSYAIRVDAQGNQDLLAG